MRRYSSPPEHTASSSHVSLQQIPSSEGGSSDLSPCMSEKGVDATPPKPSSMSNSMPGLSADDAAKPSHTPHFRREELRSNSVCVDEEAIPSNCPPTPLNEQEEGGVTQSTSNLPSPHDPPSKADESSSIVSSSSSPPQSNGSMLNQLCARMKIVSLPLQTSKNPSPSPSCNSPGEDGTSSSAAKVSSPPLPPSSNPSSSPPTPSTSTPTEGKIHTLRRLLLSLISRSLGIDFTPPPSTPPSQKPTKHLIQQLLQSFYLRFKSLNPAASLSATPTNPRKTPPKDSLFGGNSSVYTYLKLFSKGAAGFVVAYCLVISARYFRNKNSLFLQLLKHLNFSTFQPPPHEVLRNCRNITFDECSKMIREGNIWKIKHLADSKLVFLNFQNELLATDLIPGSESSILYWILGHVPQLAMKEPHNYNFIVEIAISFACLFIYWKIYRTFALKKMEVKSSYLIEDSKVDVKFSDVIAGEAKEELREVIEFLHNRKKFEDAGARLPRGILLVGPSGTGKTLLAKAVAGEASVPFLNCCAAEFVELYVGRGAERVRNLFMEARKCAPCVVFIDELDALGYRESISSSGASNEYVQTVNQILAEMDGFRTNSHGLVVIAATNRYSAIDPALIRSGRFDRHVLLELPNSTERKAIISLFIQKKGISLATGEEETLVMDMAERTSGFSGADLESFLNEAIFRSIRRNATSMTKEDIDSTFISFHKSKCFDDLAGPESVESWRSLLNQQIRFGKKMNSPK